jgi:tetratricopeptide (TPR) repeat protein
MARGRFHLFPVESDFSPALRSALLARLCADLAAAGLCLRILTLDRDCWNILTVLEQEPPILADEVVMLTGLEETPGIVAEPGAKPQRPRALAVLNQMRETLRQSIPAPFFVWCPTYVYVALLEHAPDFFDRYTAQFRFFDAEPQPTALSDRNGLNLEDAARAVAVGSLAAVDFYRQQVAAQPEPTAQRARALINLVEALRQLPNRERLENLSEAIQLAEEATRLLAKRPSRNSRYQWARGQYLLGNNYMDIPTGNRVTNLQRAITYYQAALSIFTEADYPADWASVQNNLGVAHAELPIGDRATNLQRAITHYQAALRVYTEAGYPTEWASTQNNLGNAYARLLGGDQNTNLLQAIAYYEAALQVRTEADYPVDWASTQYNLGNAYARLPVGNQAANLRRAIACYEAALRVRTETHYPAAWAATQYNLGLTLWQSDDLEGAKEAMQKAARGFRAVGREQDAQNAEAILQGVTSGNSGSIPISRSRPA